MSKKNGARLRSVAWKIAARGTIALQVAYSFFVATAHAQSFTINGPQDIGKYILCPIATWMFWILISVSTIMVLYAAFLYLTGRGEDDTISKARRTITYAAVAIAVALLAKGFPDVIAGVLGQSVTGCS